MADADSAPTSTGDRVLVFSWSPGMDRLDFGPVDAETLATSRIVRQELTSSDPDGIFRDGWDVVGPWGLWIRADGEPRGGRLPGSVRELYLYLEAYREQTARRIGGLRRVGSRTELLRNPNRWRPSAEVLWRMARILVPAQHALPQPPDVQNAEDLMHAIRVLEASLAPIAPTQVGTRPLPLSQEEGADTGPPSVKSPQETEHPTRARKRVGGEAKMLKMLSDDQERYWWSATQWEPHLRVKAGTIKGYKAWSQVMTFRSIKKAERISRDHGLDGGRRRRKRGIPTGR
jgi:hypothetical protein